VVADVVLLYFVEVRVAVRVSGTVRAEVDVIVMVPVYWVAYEVVLRVTGVVAM
jgi:hypothetical protein